jgi:tetratricopeptide (TPR) repeat protein
MEELPPNAGSNLPELAEQLYRAELSSVRQGEFAPGIDALERSLAIYQQRAEQGPRDYLHERAQVGLVLGECYRVTKRAQEAILSLGESLKILRQLAVDHPDHYLRGVAMNLVDLARAHGNIGQENEAETLFLEAVNIYRRLAQTNSDLQAYMGEVLMGLGDLYFGQKKYHHAEPACLEALQIARARNFIGPDGHLLTYVAKVLVNLGRIYHATDRIQQAEQFYSEALSFHRRLAQETPTRISSLALMLQNVGSFYAETKRPSQAETFYEEALKLLCPLAEKDPFSLSILSMVLENLNRLYLQTGHSAKAEAARRELDAILRARPNPE